MGFSQCHPPPLAIRPPALTMLCLPLPNQLSSTTYPVVVKMGHAHSGMGKVSPQTGVCVCVYGAHSWHCAYVCTCILHSQCTPVILYACVSWGIFINVYCFPCILRLWWPSLLSDIRPVLCVLFFCSCILLRASVYACLWVEHTACDLSCSRVSRSCMLSIPLTLALCM